MYFTAENGIVWGRKCHDIVLDSDAKNALQLFVSLRMYRLNQWPSFIWTFWIYILKHICPRDTSTPPFMFTNNDCFIPFLLECIKYSSSFHTIYSFPIKIWLDFIQNTIGRPPPPFLLVSNPIRIRTCSESSLDASSSFSIES